VITERVQLVGGPLDGEARHVRLGVRHVRYSSPEYGRLASEQDGIPVKLMHVELVDYRRREGSDVFEFVSIVRTKFD
jgi:hypothetical protein